MRRLEPVTNEQLSSSSSFAYIGVTIDTVEKGALLFSVDLYESRHKTLFWYFEAVQNSENSYKKGGSRIVFLLFDNFSTLLG